MDDVAEVASLGEARVDWRFTPLAAPLLVGVSLLLVIAALAVRRRPAPGSVSVPLLSLAVGAYAFGYALELGSSDVARVAFWLKFEYLGLTPVAPLLLLVVTAYAGHRRVLTPPNVAALFALPAVTCLLAWTNEAHELIWRDLRVDAAGGFTRTLFTRGPWYWVHNGYTYLLVALALGVLVHEFWRSSGLFRRQAGVMLCGLLAPAAVHLLYLAQPALHGLDPNPYALLLTALAFASGMLGSGLWDIVPLAREAALARIGDPVFVVDRSGQLADLNPPARELLAQAGNEALSRALLGAFSEGRGTGPAPALADLRLALPAGPRHYEVSLTQVADVGLGRGRMFVLHDTTRRRQAEVALRESEARFRSLFDNAPDAIVISGRDGRIVLANRQAEEAFGYAHDELIGQPVEALVPEAVRDRHRDQRAAYLAEPTLRAMGAGLELVARRKDGSELPVEISLSPVQTASGLLVTSVIRDLTLRKRSEQQLRLQGVALQAAANAMLITDRDGRIEWVNRAFERLTGYAASEVLGLTPRVLKSGVQEEGFYASLWSTILTGEVWQGETVNRRKDGSLYTEEQTIAPVRDARGEISHFIAVKQDVSERKAAERLREGLIRTMVHDLRNPLTVILGGIETALGPVHSLSLPEPVRELLQLAVRSGERMLALVNTILEVRRLQSGGVPLEREPVPLAELVEEATRLQQPLIARRGQQLVADLAPDLPDLDADRRLVSRVLQNLLDNASRFTPHAGRILIAARREDASVLVVVSDEGPGIPDELRGRLFREFAVGREEGHGTGLGLAFCRLVVEAHGGRIWAESAGGRGARLAFTLPAAGLAGVEGAAQAGGASAGTSPSSQRGS